MSGNNALIRVWDPLVRAFHWGLVPSFAVAYLVEDDWLPVHVAAGYLILGLLTFRLAWGLVGTRHARFNDFVRGPSTVFAYLKEMLACRARRHIGHNPAGGAMVIALLLCLFATGLSGMAVYGYQEFMGPFAGLLSELPDSVGKGVEAAHEVLANLTVLLVATHIAGVLVASIQHRENLVRSMITGCKRKEISE